MENKIVGSVELPCIGKLPGYGWVFTVSYRTLGCGCSQEIITISSPGVRPPMEVRTWAGIKEGCGGRHNFDRQPQAKWLDSQP